MASKVILLSSAEDDFTKLPRNIRIRVAQALRELSDFPVSRIGVKKLKPPFEGYRKRVGDYRILFDLDGGTIFVHRIKDRKDSYR